MVNSKMKNAYIDIKVNMVGCIFGGCCFRIKVYEKGSGSIAFV